MFENIYVSNDKTLMKNGWGHQGCTFWFANYPNNLTFKYDEFNRPLSIVPTCK